MKIRLKVIVSAALAAPAFLATTGVMAQQAVPASANTPVAMATATTPGGAAAAQASPQGAAQAASQPAYGQVYNGPPGSQVADGGAATSYVSPHAPGGNSVPTAGAPLPSPLLARPDPVQQVVDEVAPLTPEQVRSVRKALGDRESAENTPDRVPRTTSQVITLDMSPNASRPVVRVATNIGGTVSFVDMAGNPWPILHVDNFGARGYTVSMPSENTVSVWSINPYVTGNVAVFLKGLASPQSFIVEPAKGVANDRTDLIVPRVLPDKRDAYVGGGRGASIGGYSDELAPYLLRTPPSNAKTLRVTGLADSQAWQTSDGALIIRTQATLRSPAWERSGSAADGTHVYKLQITPLVAVAQSDGRLTYAQISGYDSVSRLSPVSAIEGGATK